MEQAPAGTGASVRVERWPTEIPLLVIVLLASIGIWVLLAVSIIGIVYAVAIGLFFFLTHLALVAYLRGSAVRLAPNQFPELYARVQELAARAGIRKVPEAYLMQAGGTLNAFATKFLRSRMIVLFADLLEACGENTRARDMVIGHELGHIRAGHLNGMWFLLPGFFVPFLGAAYSRAREYTCDRYGVALCGDSQAALRGLAILSAGGAYGPRVNLEALALQREQMDTGWMTLGKWFARHPPLCDRMAALEPALVSGRPASMRGPARAVAGLLLVFVGGSTLATLAVASWMPKFRQAFQDANRQQSIPTVQTVPAGNPAELREKVEVDLLALSKVAEEHRHGTGRLPADAEELSKAWASFGGGAEEPVDPYDSTRYGYETDGRRYRLWSAGPDGESGTADDIQHASPRQETQRP